MRVTPWSPRNNLTGLPRIQLREKAKDLEKTVQGPYLSKKQVAINGKEGVMRPGSMWFLVVAFCLLLAASWPCATAQEAPGIDKETLKSWLADPMVVIIDVRSAKDWQGSGKKIKGAVREDPKDVLTWAASLPKDKKIILYCA
jgi:hypothetical protein